MKKITLLTLCLILAFSAFAEFNYKTNSNKVNVRDCPDTKCKVLAQLVQDETVVVEKIVNGEWYYIKFGNNNNGYVKKEYLEKVDENSSNKFGLILLSIALIGIFILFIANKTLRRNKEEQELLELDANYEGAKVIYVKQRKSVGLAILLVLVLGPIGMFYSTVRGAIIMTFIVPATTVYLVYQLLISEQFVNNPIASNGIFFILIILTIPYYLVILIWAAIAARKNK